MLHFSPFKIFAIVLTFQISDHVLIETPEGGIATGNRHNYGDLPFHMGVAAGFAYGDNFPPMHPELAGVALTYPFLSDVLSAMLVRSADSWRQAFFWPTFVLGLCVLPALTRFGEAVTGSRPLGRVAAALTLFSGGLGFLRLFEPGGFEAWSVPDPEITFLGCFAEETGVTTLVGERPYRGVTRPVQGNTAGVLCQFAGDRLTLLTEATQVTRLNDATRLAGGVFLACGDWGALVRLEMGVAEHVGPLCGGHLLKIGRLPDGGAVLVGAGGHALSLSAKLEHQLEAVQTTRDLLALHVADDGVAWAGSAQTRILRRTAGNWVRMSGDLGLSSSVTSLGTGGRVVRAICDDGAVIEGILT